MHQSTFILPTQANIIFIAIFAFLSITTLIGYLAKQRNSHHRVVEELNTHIGSWWWLFIILFIAFGLGKVGITALFLGISFTTLREFLTHIYARRSDHNIIALCFYFLLPLQYYFVFSGWHDMFSALIPIYAFLLLPILGRLTGDKHQLFERMNKIQWALMITVYCLSHVPALIMLPIKHHHTGQNLLLLLFMIIVVQSSHFFYFLWRRIGQPNHAKQRVISACLSIIVASIVAACLTSITPFSLTQAITIGAILAIMGLLGTEIMSSLKYYLGIRHWGRHKLGQSGVLDYVSNIGFAAPIFFHIMHHYWV